LSTSHRGFALPIFYVVWQQNRSLSELARECILADPFRSLDAPGTNYFIVKTSFWPPVK
jgi:hypothetical protein